jgi:hypothetical protein
MTGAKESIAWVIFSYPVVSSCSAGAGDLFGAVVAFQNTATLSMMKGILRVATSMLVSGRWGKDRVNDAVPYL